MATGGVVVRDAEPAEYERVAEVTVAGFDRRPPTPERLVLLRDAAGRARDGRLLVAARDAGGELVGTASLLKAGTPNARQALAGEAELRLLAVLPAHRGQGIAYALMTEAIRLARDWDVDALVLDTGSDNFRSQRLYYRLGFTRVPARETHVGANGSRLAVFRHDLGRPDPAGSNPVAVRLSAPAEYEEIGRLSVAAYEHDYDISERYRADLADVTSRAHEHEVWVAVDRASGELLGTVVTPRPDGHLGHLAEEGELGFRLLAVAPSARRRGVGRLLVEHVIAVASLRGASAVVMNSGPHMTGAHALYYQLGFSRLPDREDRLVDGHPLFAFGLDLSPEFPRTQGAKDE